MSLMSLIPAAAVVHDACDYCVREFARAANRPAVCPSCGLENIRPAAQLLPRAPVESAMLGAAPERAVLTSPAPRRRKGKRS